MAVLSKYASTLPTSEQRLFPVTLPMQGSPGFVELSFSANDTAQSFMTASAFALAKSTILFIPCISAHATWLLGANLTATPEYVRNFAAEVCVAVGPHDAAVDMFPVSPFLCLPLLKNALLQGCVHDLLNWKALKRDKRVRARIKHTLPCSVSCVNDVVRSPMPRTLSSPEMSSEVECIICLNYAACYRWSDCRHQHEGPALVCLSCRNAILAMQQTRKQYIDKHKLQTPCVICRSMGALIKHIRSDVVG